MTDTEKIVARITELAEHAAQIDTEIRELKRQLADLGTGTHTVGHIKVTVSAPSRRFNLDRGLAFLTEEQRTLAVSPDPKKVKANLPPVLLEQCMDPGTGDPIVRLS